MVKVLKKQFIALELVRFIFAFMVLVWHYQHFFSVKNGVNYYVVTKAPFYNELTLFFTKGLTAVSGFWVLSGFIFHWKFLNKIQNDTMKFKEFFIDRFSRLYPLHFATLFWVLFLQLIYFHYHTVYFQYVNTDINHFVSNLFFSQSWNDTNPAVASFNGPTWSVSAEILIYGVFFIFALKLRRYCVYLWFLPIIFFYLTATNFAHLQQVYFCGIYFFSGGICYLIYNYSNFAPRGYLVKILLLLLCLFCFRLFPTAIKDLPVFMGLIFIAADLDNYIELPQKLCQFFGNLTYSSYLIHFPLQIIMVLIVDHIYNYNSRDVFYTKWMFLTFIGITFILGRIIFVYYERPMQNKIRSYFK